MTVDEIKTSGEGKQSLRWKDGVWDLRWGIGDPEESSIPGEIDFDPCDIVGGPITVEISSDPEDSSWMAPVDLSKGIPACIPGIANTPLFPYARFDRTEDGSSRLTLEGLYYWGVQEDKLCEWTRFDTFDPGNLSDEELELTLEGNGIDPLEWRISGESSAEHLLTAVIPAETQFNPDWFGLDLHRKNGTGLYVSYDPEYGLDLSAAVGDVEYSFHDGESELEYATGDSSWITADYDQADGRLVRYRVFMGLPDGTSISYTYERNGDAGEPEYRMEYVSHQKDGQYTDYSCNSQNEWHVYHGPGVGEEIESLPEELAEACTPITVILPDAE